MTGPARNRGRPSFLRGLALPALLLASTGGNCAQDVPHVFPAMLTADYWISRTPAPDEVFLSEWDIRRLNRLVSRKGHTVNPHSEPRWISGARIRGYIEGDHRTLREWKKYDSKNRRRRDPEFDGEMRLLTRPEEVPERIGVRYGLVVRRVQILMMPTDQFIQRRPDDPAFNIMFKMVVEAGTKIAIYYYNADRKWAFVQAPSCYGWMQVRDLCWSRNPADFRGFLDARKFLVVTGREEAVFSRPRLGAELTRVSMGGRLPLLRRGKRHFVVSLPVRGPGGKAEFREGYIPVRADVSQGYLKMTRRNLLRQCFKWLGVGYKWGASGYAVDCSSFIMGVFRTFGLNLHRNSQNQVETFGRFRMPTDPARKEARLSRLVPFRTLLGFPGHIGFYLGKVNGRHYMIHAISSYWTKKEGGDAEVRLERVVVSSLDLGRGGKSGSLMDKLETASLVD